MELHAALYRPSGEGPHPVIVSVYGGPGPQMVNDSWGQTVDLRAQLLAEHGFLVLKVDNRGSARRGLGLGSGRQSLLSTTTNGYVLDRDRVDVDLFTFRRLIASDGRSLQSDRQAAISGNTSAVTSSRSAPASTTSRT